MVTLLDQYLAVAESTNYIWWDCVKWDVGVMSGSELSRAGYAADYELVKVTQAPHYIHQTASKHQHWLACST